jgi:hypothetical protein
MARISGYVWSCCQDKQSCEECKAKNGLEWKSKKAITIKPPLRLCTSQEGCRCEIIPVYDDEGVVTLG